MILGVEAEFHIEGNPRPEETFETRYPIVVSHMREARGGFLHRRNGDLVREISNLSGDAIRVGYDATASFGDMIWDGYELNGEPMSLEDNLRIWRLLYDSEVMVYLNPNPDIARLRNAPAHHSCGMHVHVSGELDSECIRKLSGLINIVEHGRIMEYVAGRPANRYCRRVSPGDGFFRVLFHSDDCRHEGKIDRSQLGSLCCDNERVLALVENGRHYALNCLPNAGTGDIEFRMFASPSEFPRFAANLEFVYSAITFCQEGNWNDVAAYCRWLEGNKGTYRYLFRYLRDGGFVRGLLPRRR